MSSPKVHKYFRIQGSEAWWRLCGHMSDDPRKWRTRVRYCEDKNQRGDWDYRSPRTPLQDIETGANLAEMGNISQFLRMDFESSDVFTEVDDLYRRTKIIVRRDPEKQQGADPEERDSEDNVEVSPDDAMTSGRCDQLSALDSPAAVTASTNEEESDKDNPETSSPFSEAVVGRWLPPRERWDLIYSFEPCNGWQCDPGPGEGCKVHKRFSAKVFLPPAWKNKLSGRVSAQGKTMGAQQLFDRLERLIHSSVKVPHGRFIFAMATGLPPRARKRIWEIWKAEVFFREKGTRLPPDPTPIEPVTEEAAELAAHYLETK